jgi:hypothetical protein
MGKLIEDLMRTKVPPPAYSRIQEFLTKVNATFPVFSITGGGMFRYEVGFHI